LNSYRIGHRDDDDDSSRIGHRDDDDSNRIGLSVPFVSVPFDWGHYIGTGVGVKDGHSAQLESAQTKQASKPAQKALVTGKHSQSKQKRRPFDHPCIVELDLDLDLDLECVELQCARSAFQFEIPIEIPSKNRNDEGSASGSTYYGLHCADCRLQ
jgi:hypothetical protein